MSPRITRLTSIATSALAGALLGLIVGLVAIVVAPSDGFGDLAAGAVTSVVLVPVGLTAGALVGWWYAKSADGGTHL